jgi:hypothetical protein
VKGDVVLPGDTSGAFARPVEWRSDRPGYENEDRTTLAGD